MAGNNTIRGDETVTFTDNLSFDGTERGGKLDSDKQLFLGATSAPHVRKATLTTDGSVTLTQSAPTSTTASLDVSINGPVNVDTGGTGRASHIAYSPICGGTTTTSAQQSVASVGTSGQVLTSNGAGALPTFQDLSVSGNGFVFLSSLTASNSASLDFTSDIDSTYNAYLFTFESLSSNDDVNNIYVRTSTDGGSTWDSGASDYDWCGYKRVSSLISYNDFNDSEINTAIIMRTNAGSFASGTMLMISPSSSSNTAFILDSFMNDTTDSGVNLMGGSRKSTTAVDAIQFFGSVGNILAGTISMYGMTTPS